jgi:ABC-2 type transport system ATP-binding protein
MLAVQTRNLTRKYQARSKTPEVTALDDVSVEIEEGEVRGLLGPNGAGKTTLTKILSTVLLPTTGSASILGHDVTTETRAVRRLIGVVFGGDRGLYPHLTARQNLTYWAALYELPGPAVKAQVEALLERVGLTERADAKAQTFSRGMKQRLHLARGMIADARVLLLDEPTMGMDPLAARDFRQLIKLLQAEGRTILLTTHDMAEAEAVCDKVSLIDRGRVVAEETPQTLGRLVARHGRVDFEGGEASLAERLSLLPGTGAVTRSNGAGAFRVELTDEDAVHEVLSCLVAAGVTSIRTSRPSLEEVYVQVIGDRGLRV